MGKKIIKGIDPLIYLTANKFYNIAKEANKLYSEPIIVNLSFSIELYLKSINTTTNYLIKKETNTVERQLKTIHGHPLDKIFEKLASLDQTNLKTLYQDKYNSNLIEDLQSIKNAFIDYRYLFEKDSSTINLTILYRIPEFLKEYIENEMSQGKFNR